MKTRQRHVTQHSPGHGASMMHGLGRAAALSLLLGPCAARWGDHEEGVCVGDPLSGARVCVRAAAAPACQICSC